MSQQVEPHELAATVAGYGTAPFLLYSAADGTSARINHVRVSLVEGAPTVIITGFGRGVARRATDGARLSLLWPPSKEDQLSVIADGQGELTDEDTMVMTIESAVLHRPAPPLGESATC